MNPLSEVFEQHKKGHIQYAQDCYYAYIQTHPHDVSVILLFAITYGQLGDYRKSHYWLKRALALEPKNPRIHNNLGNVLKRQNKPQKAMEHYQTALALAPNSAATHHNIAVLYQQNHAYDKAKTHYEQALTIQPDYLEARYYLALLHIKMQQTDQAKEHLQALLSTHPKNAHAHYQLGQLYHQEQALPEAIHHYTECLKEKGNHAMAHHNLAAALVNQGQHDQAIHHFKKTLEIEPKHDTAHENLAAVYLAQNNTAQALKHYLSQLEAQPSIDSYYNIGVIYLHQERHQEAIDYLNTALTIDPEHENTHINLGAVYLKRSDHAQAKKHYELALSLNPENTEIQYMIHALDERIPSTPKAPAAYVKNLFDHYAPYFDQHLTQYLHYTLPQQLHDFMSHHMDVDPHDWSICDLGCGSGLSGQAFRSWASYLVGMDLSPNMLRMAEGKKMYNGLITADITQAWTLDRPYDLMLCVDTLPYMGAVDTFFERVARHTKPGGYFLLSTEAAERAPYQLQKTARFAHHPDYIQNMAAQQGFKTAAQQHATIRQDRGRPVRGHLWLLVRKDS